MRNPIFVLLLATVHLAAPAAMAQPQIETSLGPLGIAPMATGLTEPWGLAFLPGGGFLVTERDGRLTLHRDGQVTEVEGLPEVHAEGQGGLLDVMVPRDFATSREVFVSYSKPRWRRQGTALGVGRLSEDGTRLDDFRVLFEMDRGGKEWHHYGSRIVEAPDGTLFLTIGDRGQAELAQDPARHNGSVVRVARDGSIPPDNPFVGRRGAADALYSKGHRNAQGATLDAEGQLWVVEHGAQGGDELNRVARGANYGWPVISYGRNYDGSPIGTGTAADGLEQPVHYWDPSIAPSGLAVVSGPMFPEWQGDFLVGSLKFDAIYRVDPDAGFAEEVLSAPQTGRVRDLRIAPDGSIWFLSVHDGAVYRIARD